MPYPPHRPKPRGVRSRIVRAGAVCGLALVPVAFAGCDYPAGPGSALTIRFSYNGYNTTVNDFMRTSALGTARVYKDSEAHPGGDLKITDGNGNGVEVDPYTVELLNPTALVPKLSEAGTWLSSDMRCASCLSTSNIMNSRFTFQAASTKIGSSDDRYVFSQTLTEIPVPTPTEVPIGGPISADLFSHDSPAFIPANPEAMTPTILDARQSIGADLTYSWDLNGDGTFGITGADNPQGGWTAAGVPARAAGTAFVPAALLFEAVGSSFTPAVRVTNSSGSSQKSILLPVRRIGAGGLSVTRATNGQAVLKPLIGTLPLGPNPDDVTSACVRYSSRGEAGLGTTDGIPIGDDGSFTGDYTTVAANGTYRVSVDFFAGIASPCSNPTTPTELRSTHTELVSIGSTAVGIASSKGAGAHEMAAAPAPKGYSGKARVRLNGGAIVAVGKTDGTSMSGVINQGKYSLTAPTRTRRTARPPALALFAKGDFASSSNAKLGFSETNATTPLTGTSTVLLRGAKGALGCMSVVRTDTTTTWSFLGGTRAASKLRMTLTGGPTLNSTINQAAAPPAVRATAKGAKGRKAASALRPVATNYAITASAKGASRALPAACRALKGRLP